MQALRAALWAAVSSKPQAEKISNKEQLRLGHEAADKLGAQVVAELVVPGESRNIVLFEDAARKMAAYADLKRLIDARAMDVFIYYDQSRLGRQAALSMAVVGLCAEAGVATYELESPPSTLEHGGSTQDVYLGAIKSAGAQAEIEKLRHRHRMGMIGRVRKGLAPSHVGYGYTVTYDAHGERMVVVDAAAAVVVRRIVAMYLAGNGSETIANALNADGIASPGGSEWTRFTVMRLFDTSHWWAGYAVVNRRSRTGRPYTSAKARWQPIIDQATYAAILDERATRKPNRKLADARHVLSGVCACMICGAPLVLQRTDYAYCYFVCRSKHEYLNVRDDVVMAAIQEQLALLRTVDIATLLDATTDNAATQLAERLEAQRQIITKTQTAMRRVDDAYADGTLDAERYRLQVDRLKAQAVQAAAEIERLNALVDAEAANGSRLQRLTYARDHAGDILTGPSLPANVYLRRLLRVWCQHHEVTSIEWL